MKPEHSQTSLQVSDQLDFGLLIDMFILLLILCSHCLRNTQLPNQTTLMYSIKDGEIPINSDTQHGGGNPVQRKEDQQCTATLFFLMKMMCPTFHRRTSRVPKLICIGGIARTKKSIQFRLDLAAYNFQ